MYVLKELNLTRYFMISVFIWFNYIFIYVYIQIKENYFLIDQISNNFVEVQV